MGVKAQLSEVFLGTLTDQLVAQHYTDVPLQGMSIGIIQGEQIHIFHYGNIADTLPAVLPNNHTLYLLGSITKVFTASLLTAMVADSVVRLEDPITLYLPDSMAAANPALSRIKLLQLATHTSGLPAKPSNLADSFTDPNDPYAQYSIAQLYHYLSTFAPPPPATIKRKKNKANLLPSNRFAYSHVGMGLLAHLLENATHQSYQQLLDTYLLQDLGCGDTYQRPPANRVAAIADGHNFVGKTSPTLHYLSLYGSEGLYSSLDNMLKLVYANMDNSPQNPLSNALKQTQQAYGHTPMPDVKACMGWYQIEQGKHVPLIYTHSGRTGGYGHYVAFLPQIRLGIIIMTNTNRRVDGLGIDLLEKLLKYAHE